MLILRTNSDLPISIRNLGHSIGQSIKRIEMIYKTDIDLPSYPRLKSICDQHLYNMSNIGRNVLDLGQSDDFDLSRVHARLAYLQDDYFESARTLVAETYSALYENDRESFDLISALLLNEVDRKFEDEIQLSSVNRLEELQNLKETTAISTIAGLLRTDWSAKSFVGTHKDLFEQEAKRIEESFRESVYDKLGEMSIEEIEKEIEKELKLADGKLENFCDESVVPVVAEEINQFYDEMFVPNEDLGLLKQNSEKVVSNCMLRGAAKKLILSFNDHLREEVSPQILDFIKMTAIKNLLEKIESEVEEVLKENFEYCNHEFNNEEDYRVLTILPVSADFNDFILDQGDSSISIDKVYFGGTELDIKIDLKSKTAKLIKAEVDISEIVGHDINTGFGIEFIEDRSFEKDVLDSIESFIENLARQLIETIESTF